LLPDREIQSLVTLIENTANRLPWLGAEEAAPLRIHAMWAIVSQYGMEGRPHRHAGGSWAPTMWMGRVRRDGERCVCHLYAARTTGQAGDTESGLMLLFPGRMLHGVRRYESDRPRIVLSFNLQ